MIIVLSIIIAVYSILTLYHHQQQKQKTFFLQWVIQTKRNVPEQVSYLIFFFLTEKNDFNGQIPLPLY